jgi:hypothetical protein
VTSKIRFIDNEDGTEIPLEAVREWFFDSATDVTVNVDVEQVWRQALNGDEALWELIEEVCGVQIVKDDGGLRLE